ncbi:hypothetical protein MTO96_000367 [Rhipicephalus appendiculatus]
MGAPPIIEEPVVIKTVGYDIRDYHKDLRAPKGKRPTVPNFRTTRGSNHDHNPDRSHLQLVRPESASCSPAFEPTGDKGSRSKQRQRRAHSSTPGQGDGCTMHPGKDKKHREKEDGSKQRHYVEEKQHRKVTAAAATSPPEEFSPQRLSSPTCTRHSTATNNERKNKRTAAADVLPAKCRDQGDFATVPKYELVCKVASVATGDGKYCTSKTRPARKMTENSRGRKGDKNHNERHASKSVENKAPEAAVTSEKEAPLQQSAVTGNVFVDPSTPLRHFRYEETVKTGPWQPAQQPLTVDWGGVANAGCISSDGLVSYAPPQSSGPAAAPPTALLPPADLWNEPFQQLSPEHYNQQGDVNFGPAQFTQVGLQQQLPLQEVGTYGSPSTWTNERVQIEGRRLRQHMNREYSPCDNFYRYICEKRPITPGQAYGDGAFSSADILLEEFLASALRDYVLNEHHRDVAPVRTLYSACLRPTSNSLTDIQREAFGKLPIGRWPYKGNSLLTSDIWQTAGLLVRRFGVVSILEVSFGIKPDTTRPTIELRYPRYLYFDDYSLGGVETLRDAVPRGNARVGKFR